jgi:SAM-dependent methyltransferase
MTAAGYDEYALIADFYDHVVPYRERPDVNFFVEMALQAAGPVLEAGCGTGRILIPTARAGVNITGLDISKTMLQICRQRLARETQDVQRHVALLEADMRGFDLPSRFTLATLPFRPFQHLLSVDDQIACLRTLNRHLVNGGKIILDVFDPYLPYLAAEKFGEESEPEPEFVMPDGRQVTRRFRITGRDRARQIQEVELLYDVRLPQGGQERLVHSFAMRYFFRYEIEHLLSRCGFEVEALYGDYDRTPFGEKYPGELIFVARRGD